MDFSINNFVASTYSPPLREPLIGSLVYLLVVVGLKKVMSSLNPAQSAMFTATACVHNVILIVVSFMMGMGGVIALAERYKLEGFDGIFCSQPQAW